ncbi:hypothetical protein BCR34DRAFT_226997 [Clohesyomyces aquaticus]|uniref:Uncharacterized protein n=1 Tax=Clohesyomyces aquaticus TaxID=1231657 RepID=A0A1Y1Y9A3_9PLEO|nr:hypothetical protein BCR34DRAFT_226997 [Clohesyomyces aquaticus]
MASFSILRVTVLSYFILITVLLILGLSISEIVLEGKVLSAFSNNLQVQVPGTSLAEWLFVPIRPRNLKSGGSEGIIVVGILGVLCALLQMAWILMSWWGMRNFIFRGLGRLTCTVTLICTTASLAILGYVFIEESQRPVLPEYYTFWHDLNFTREFWACTAFPSQISNTDEIYGLAICAHAQAGRWMILPLSNLLLALSILTFVQAWRMNVFGLRKEFPTNILDVEKGDQGSRQSQSSVIPRLQLQRPGELDRKPEILHRNRWSLLGFYAKS